MEQMKTTATEQGPRMHRGNGRVISGVCAMVAGQLGIDATLIRVATVILATLSLGLVFWAYVALWALTPPTALGRSPLTRGVDWLNGMLGSKRGSADQVPTRVQ